VTAFLAVVSLLADIAVGKTGGAEVFFLIGCILAGIATIIAVMAKALWGACLSAAVCLALLGWVLL